MKLFVYRLINLIVFLLTMLLGIFYAIYNIVSSNLGLRSSNDFILYLIGILIGVLFLGFEIVFIAKSFKNKTVLLHAICTKEKSLYKKNKVILIIDLIFLAIGVGLIIVNSLFYARVIVTPNVDEMMMDFNFFFSLIIFINALSLLIYYLFIVQDDIEVVD